METRKQQLLIGALTLIVLLGLTACGGSADFDIRGTWEYTMIATDGNTYDHGTITFSGNPSKGSYLELNIYLVEYEGEYQIKGTTLTFTGDESWQGAVESANQMSGTWQHDDGFSGTFTAMRQQP